MFKLSIGFEPRFPVFGYQTHLCRFFNFSSTNCLICLQASSEKTKIVCVWLRRAVQNAAHFEVELFRSLRWGGSKPAQLHFRNWIYRKKIYKTKKCQLWNPSRDCLSLARAFHLLFLPLGNKMTLLPKQHWVVVDHSRNKRGCVFPRIEKLQQLNDKLEERWLSRKIVANCQLNWTEEFWIFLLPNETLA